jgi:hypothetical protein
VALRPDCRRQLARQLTGAGTKLEDPFAGLEVELGEEPPGELLRHPLLVTAMRIPARCQWLG